MQLSSSYIFWAKQPRAREGNFAHIEGEIENLGDKNCTYTKVAATLYDTDGNVVSVAYSYCLNSTIAPFDKSFLKSSHQEKISSNTTHVLVAESKEYLGEEKYLADLNRDGTINILDIAIVALAFGCGPTDENWNQIADLNKDGTINIVDIATVVLEFGNKS